MASKKPPQNPQIHDDDEDALSSLPESDNNSEELEDTVSLFACHRLLSIC